MTISMSGSHPRRPHLNYWLVAVLALAAGLIALGSWTLVDRYTGSSENEATKIVDDLNAAVNAGDTRAVRQLFARNVVFTMPTGERLSGIDKVLNVALIPHASGLHLKRVGPVANAGNLAAAFVETEAGIEFVVWELANGKIVSQSVYSP